MNEFEEFEPKEGKQFEEFELKDEIEERVTVESFGGLINSEDEVKRILAARDELEKRLMVPISTNVVAGVADDEPYIQNNIVGVGIGEKVINGVPIGKLAIKVLVKEKIPESRLSSETLVPKIVGGVITDIEESGEIYAQMFSARRQPVPCGVSIGNCNTIMTGTLGCLVTRNNQLFILSTNHIMAATNTSPLNAPIYHPGSLDGDVSPQDILARLRQFVPINFTPGAINIVDAAIAQTSPRLVDRRILRLEGVLQKITPEVVDPILNMQVQKSGRTTRYRRGFINIINLTVDINYAPVGGVARFIRQFCIKGWSRIFSDRGDSGSLVTTFPQNQPVGLLFAGNPIYNISICNPINIILAAFGVNIVV